MYYANKLRSSTCIIQLVQALPNDVQYMLTPLLSIKYERKKNRSLPSTNEEKKGENGEFCLALHTMLEDLCAFNTTVFILLNYHIQSIASLMF